MTTESQIESSAEMPDARFLQVNDRSPAAKGHSDEVEPRSMRGTTTTEDDTQDMGGGISGSSDPVALAFVTEPSQLEGDGAGDKTEIEKVSRSVGAEVGAVPAARRDEKGTASKMRGGKGTRGRIGRVQMSYMQKLSPKLDGIPEEEGGDEAEVAPAGPPVMKSLALNLGQEPAAAIAAEGPVTNVHFWRRKRIKKSVAQRFWNVS